MTNEETLQLLKPIMLDGTEKEGDKVYHIRYGSKPIAEKEKKAAKKAIDMFAHQLVGNITFYFPGIKVNHY